MLELPSRSHKHTCSPFKDEGGEQGLRFFAALVPPLHKIKQPSTPDWLCSELRNGSESILLWLLSEILACTCIPKPADKFY